MPTSTSRGGSRPEPPADGRAAPAPPSVTPDQVGEFEQVAAHLSAIHQEFAVQAKPKPDHPINVFKLGMVNEKLARANALLAGEYTPVAGFETFAADALPTNSDVALVLRAYLASLERWRSARVLYTPSQGHAWRTADGTHVTAAKATRFAPEDR